MRLKPLSAEKFVVHGHDPKNYRKFVHVVSCYECTTIYQGPLAYHFHAD
jgi:hypothetical protein